MNSMSIVRLHHTIMNLTNRDQPQPAYQHYFFTGRMPFLSPTVTDRWQNRK